MINEDQVSPERGFPPHDHSDVEIISVVLDGELAHQDSSGGTSIISADEVQIMSAGTGITHSEYNPSSKKPVRFLQIWILPDEKGLPPRYQKAKLPTSAWDRWVLIASRTGRDQSLSIHQDVDLFMLQLRGGAKAQMPLEAGRYGWIQMIEGGLALEKFLLHTGDGAAIDGEKSLNLNAKTSLKLLFFI